MLQFLVRVGMMGMLCLLAAGCSVRDIDWQNTGAPEGTGFVSRSLAHEGRSHNYTVFIPYNYSNHSKVPVILFLHGLFEGGDDGRQCARVGLGPAIDSRAETFPFIVVFPQSKGIWRGEKHEALALGALDAVLKDYPGADRERIILSGLSNGGDGVWWIGARNPERFAALVPLCGVADYDDAPKLTAAPIWAFHNSGDPFKSARRAKEMCSRVEQAGGSARYTEYDEFGHDCWTRAYEESDVVNWMLRQRRTNAMPAVADGSF